MSEPLYFDVTDIVRHAADSERVSGIQRVQFNLIGHLRRAHGGESIRCVFHHPTLDRMVQFDAGPIFEHGEFDSAVLLHQLGLEPIPRVLPEPRRLKRHLRRYEGNKLLRSLHKADAYLSALLLPRRLARLGLARRERTYPLLPLTPLDRLPAGAHYVVMSISVATPRMVELGREHARRGGDVVQFVYDLIPQFRPDFFPPVSVQAFRAWLAETLHSRPRAICISEYTAADLRRHIGAAAGEWDIRSIPLAHELDGFPRGARVAATGRAAARLAGQPFVLCVGTLEVRKNGLTLLRAWQRLGEALGDALPMLVFAGKRGWFIEAFDALLEATPGLARRVLCLESPSDAELAWLYGHCLFTAYPSWYEGWGLPVGEAAWFGKYCIASRASSIPEVCGDLADYVDPDDVDGLARRLQHALAEPAYVRDREARIAAASLRRWQDVANDIHRLVLAGPAGRKQTGQGASPGAAEGAAQEAAPGATPAAAQGAAQAAAREAAQRASP